MITIRPIRYLVAACICFAVTLAILLLVGCGRKPADQVNIQPIEIVNGQSVDEWIRDLEEHPPRRDPLRSYGFKEPDSTWTGWNKIWLGAAVAGQIADGATTIDAIDSGNCREANPLLGDDPDSGLIIATKLGVIGTGIWITEYWLAGSDRQQQYRNWIFGTMAAIGAGAGAWNYNQSCN